MPTDSLVPGCLVKSDNTVFTVASIRIWKRLYSTSKVVLYLQPNHLLPRLLVGSVVRNLRRHTVKTSYSIGLPIRLKCAKPPYTSQIFPRGQHRANYRSTTRWRQRSIVARWQGYRPRSPNHAAIPSQNLSLIAAIDLGSNSFHMVVAKAQNGEIRILERLGESATGRRDRRRAQAQ